ncbi:AraC family transcriptional regulator [Gordonia sp. NPDC003424]
MAVLHNPRRVNARRTANPVQRRVRPRGVPPALEHRAILDTDDLAVAQKQLPTILAVDRLDLVSAGERAFHAVVHGVRSRDISLLYLDLAGADFEIARHGDQYGVYMQMSGSSDWMVNGVPVTSSATHAVVANPGDQLRCAPGIDSTLLVLSFGAARTNAYLSRLRGRETHENIRFDADFDLTAEAASRWHSAIQLLTTELFYPGSLLHQGVGFGPVEDLLMSTLIYVQGSTYRDDLVARPHPVARRTVRAAIDYIDGHLAEPICIADVVRAAGVSERSLQQGFREELHTTPSAYIRNSRLDRVHDVLADSLPTDGVTVSDVAGSWGFSHLGNFAAAYRARFGEPPSQTLRR